MDFALLKNSGMMEISTKKLKEGTRIIMKIKTKVTKRKHSFGCNFIDTSQKFLPHIFDTNSRFQLSSN